MVARGTQLLSFRMLLLIQPIRYTISIFAILLFAVQVKEQATVSEAMKFSTGLDRVPPSELEFPIVFEYRGGVLPMVLACFNVLTIQLPTGNGSYED